MAKKSLLFLAFMLVGCAHLRLSGGDLDKVVKPAFVSRIEEGAGPKSLVFREDDVYRDKLKRLDPKEADRRLQVKLLQTSRFAISERLRAVTLSHLPAEAPWNQTVSGALVAQALESFLVEEVPANAPDFQLLKPLGADAVVEFVVQDYGMRSEAGRAGAYVRGFARMFMLEGGEIWRRPFDEDEVRDHVATLDPFQVGKDPTIFRNQMARLLDKVARECADELAPVDRRGGKPIKTGSTELNEKSDSTHKTGRENELDNELPSPSDSPQKTGRETEIKLENGADKQAGEHGPTAPGMQTPTEAPVQTK